MPMHVSTNRALSACCKNPFSLTSDDPKFVAAIDYGNQSNLARIGVPIGDEPIALKN